MVIGLSSTVGLNDYKSHDCKLEDVDRLSRGDSNSGRTISLVFVAARVCEAQVCG